LSQQDQDESVSIKYIIDVLLYKHVAGITLLKLMAWSWLPWWFQLHFLQVW